MCGIWMNGGLSPGEILARAPTDAETARRAVEPYREMSFPERWKEFEAVQGDMDGFLAGREPSRAEPGHPFWMHWKDPSLGSPA